MYYSKANPEQLEAITTTDGPLLIIAGPGSGKTFTLVERVIYLVTEKNVLPENIFLATFTEKAAHELETRISNRLHELEIPFNINEMYLGTFHSICLRILKENREFTRLKRNFIMMDQFDQGYFLYQRLREYLDIPEIGHVTGRKRLSNWNKAQNLLKWLNKVSEEALDVNHLLDAVDEPVRVLGQCYQLYQQQLEEANALDFSTIQSEALKLLRENSDVLDKLQGKITHFMIDEYQDTNTIQELILNLLAGEHPNLCVVGDDDQGLYRFRGATIRNILQFKDQFEDSECAEVQLTTNYRSHPEIISFYNQWITDQNWIEDGVSFRHQKTISPQDQAFPQGPTVLSIGGDNEKKWQQEVLEFLLTLRDKGRLTDWNQVAFLLRSVKTDRNVRLARFLERNGIPVYSPRSNQFFEREEIRLMIGALIFLFPQFPEVRKWSEDAHLDIWDYYDEDCFGAFAQELRKPENEDLLKWCKTHAKQHLNLTSNADYAFLGLFYRLLRFPLFSNYLAEDYLQKTLMHSRAMRNLGLFSQMLNKFEYLHNINVLTPDFLEKNIKDLFNQFLRYLQDGGLDEYEDESEYAPSGSVSFLTIHQSKGLEYPVVIVGSLWTVPRKNYTALDELLEQSYLTRPPFEPLEKTKYYDFWRLFYTAYSRAQNILALTADEVREGHGKNPSKYFLAYYDSLPSWRDRRFKPQQIPLDKIKDVNLKREYSFTSDLSVYENCAEQYRFIRELAFAPNRQSPILFGTLVHQTIEDIHKTVLRGEEDLLSRDQVDDWFDLNYNTLTKRERVYLDPYRKNLAREQVQRYYQRHENEWDHIRESEVDVSLVKDAYILTGKIDLIAGQDGTVEIVDFKSEKKPDVNDLKDRDKLERYRRQLEVYAHIVQERTGLEVSKSHLYYTSEKDGNPYITWDKDERAIENTIQTFDQVVDRIEERDYRIPERPIKVCQECDLQHYCDAKNWIFLEEN
ncbi:MAG TPA: ATP-dependent helicase [Chloroflexi bacterium]|nr:ATP-dependent helicase [Chloroflexota bacterium]